MRSRHEQRAPANFSEPKRAVSQALSIESAARSGDSLATLKALRDRLAGEFDRCRNRLDMAAVSARLFDVLAQIETEERGRRRPSGTPLSNEVFQQARQLVATAFGNDIPASPAAATHKLAEGIDDQ